jgi:hypothetical protein
MSGGYNLTGRDLRVGSGINHTRKEVSTEGAEGADTPPQARDQGLDLALVQSLILTLIPTRILGKPNQCLFYSSSHIPLASF